MSEISKHDFLIVSQFRHELTLIHQIMQDGHTRNCAEIQVWGSDDHRQLACTCKLGEAPDE